MIGRQHAILGVRALDRGAHCPHPGLHPSSPRAGEPRGLARWRPSPAPLSRRLRRGFGSPRQAQHRGRLRAGRLLKPCCSAHWALPRGTYNQFRPCPLQGQRARSFARGSTGLQPRVNKPSSQFLLRTKVTGAAKSLLALLAFPVPKPTSLQRNRLTAKEGGRGAVRRAVTWSRKGAFSALQGSLHLRASSKASRPHTRLRSLCTGAPDADWGSMQSSPKCSPTGRPVRAAALLPRAWLLHKQSAEHTPRCARSLCG